MSPTLSLASVLSEAARRWPDGLALVQGEQRLSFGELWQQVLAQAGALVEHGVQPGDKIALIAPNTVEFPRAYYAIIAAGAVVVPVHLLLTAEEMAYVLTDSQARLALCHPLFAETGAAAAAQAGVPMLTVGAPGPAGPDGRRLEDTAATPLATFRSREPLDPAVVFYTSGTTGQPKGAVLNHLNLVMNATVNAFDANQVGPADTALGALPLFHTFGQTVSMNSTWRAGATLVLLPRFDAGEAIRLMVAENVNTFHGVPQMYLALLAAAAEAAELPRLRLCISGGAPLPTTVLERFDEVFGVQVLEGYGLSETSPTATVNQPWFGTRAGTVGHPLWGVEVEVAAAEVEERIELLPAEQLGEIVIRGHNVFSGYLNRPSETEAVLVDGWFRTGDLGTKSPDGFISIIDRKKDLILRGGFNVYPREVEEVLIRHPAIAEAAVIGLPDDVHGEEVCAVIISKPGIEVDANEIIQWSRDKLGRHKYPRRIEFVEAYPVGPSHKILKRELRDRFGGNSATTGR